MQNEADEHDIDFEQLIAKRHHVSNPVGRPDSSAATNTISDVAIACRNPEACSGAQYHQQHRLKSRRTECSGGAQIDWIHVTHANEGTNPHWKKRTAGDQGNLRNLADAERARPAGTKAMTELSEIRAAAARSDA